MKLEEVARIGPKTASLFKKLHVTTVEELVKTPNITENVAKSIYNFFH